MKYHSQKGFTLLELLLAIGIIAMLAAILTPILCQMRDSARSKSSGQNIKKVGLGILQYLQDNDDKFPRAGHSCEPHAADANAAATAGAPGGPAGPSVDFHGVPNQCGGDEWQDAVGPYVGDKRIFLDSADYSEVGEGPWGGGTGTMFNTTDGNLSFIINDMLSHRTPTSARGYADVANQDPRSDGLTRGDVKTPSQCLLLTEGHGGWDKAGSNNGANVVVSDWTGSTDVQNKWHHDYSLQNSSFLLTSTAYDGTHFIRTDLPFHRNGANMFYADGHAAFVTLQDKSGKPLLCKNLPWPKSVDPQQRHAERNSCKDPSNPLPGGWAAPNWY